MQVEKIMISFRIRTERSRQFHLKWTLHIQEIVPNNFQVPLRDIFERVFESKRFFSFFLWSNFKCFREHLQQLQVKVYSDGLIGTMTARVMTNYLVDKLGLGIGLQGFNYFNQSRLTNFVAALQSFRPDGRGFDFHAHTVGDRAVFEALNAYEQSLAPNTRHRCTHVELVSPGTKNAKLFCPNCQNSSQVKLNYEFYFLH